MAGSMAKSRSLIQGSIPEDAANGDVEAMNLCLRSSYVFCLEAAFDAILQARALVRGDAVDENHELERIQRLIGEALEAS